MKHLICLVFALILAACTTTTASNGAETDGDTSAAASQPVDGVAAVGDRCGTIANIECGDDAFCDIEDPAAGFDLSGSCVERPAACPDIKLEPTICGRDGKLYETECRANVAGVDIVTEGAEITCPPA